MQLAIIENHNSHGRYYMTMSKDKQNNGEKEIKCDSNTLCYKHRRGIRGAYGT